MSAPRNTVLLGAAAGLVPAGVGGRVVRAIAALVTAGMLLGCGRGTDGVTLEVWAMGREGEVLPELLDEFHRRNPGIRVEVQQLPWKSAHEKLLTAFAGGALPDLCQLGNTWNPELAALGALSDLAPRLAASPGIDPADYFPGIWATNVIDGVQIGVPWYVDTRAMYYRKDLLAAAGWDAPPATWAEWRAAMVKLKGDLGDERFGVLLPLNEFEAPVILALQQPGEMLRDGGRFGNFQSEDFRRAFSFYLELFEDGLAPAMSDTAISNVWNEFDRGYFAFYWSGPWNIGEFKRRLPASSQDRWGTAPLPGPHGPGASVAGGSSLVQFRSSKHLEEGWKLIEYLSEPATMLRFFRLTGNLPPRESVWREPELAADPYARAFHDQLGRVRPQPQVPEWERIAERIRLAAEAVARGTTTIDEALNRLDFDADRILEKRRALLDRRGGPS
jgi:multiple sugar transport system substrate-binding protein